MERGIEPPSAFPFPKILPGDGKHISDYINEVRLGHAKALLATTDMSVDAISEKLHYSSRNYFSKVFRKHFETGELIVSKPSWFNYETVIGSFHHLLENYPITDGKRIFLILDNAPWHKKAVRLVQTEALPEYQDIRDKMSLLFLPPYSPDLNPIEQVWRITRREVTHNTYFANELVLQDTLDSYFASLRQPNEKLASLCDFKYVN